MKTEEDEAFDDLAKRQGDWGGGFQAKRAMAADKLQEPYDQTALELCEVCGWKTLIPDDGCLNCERAQPAQEPASYLHTVLNAYGPDEGISFDQKAWSQLHAAIKAALAQPAQESDMLTIAYQSGYHDGKKAATDC